MGNSINRRRKNLAKKPGASPEISDWMENNARKALWAPSSPFFHVLLRSSSVGTPSFLPVLRPMLGPPNSPLFARRNRFHSSGGYTSPPPPVPAVLRVSQHPHTRGSKRTVRNGPKFTKELSFYFHLDAALFGFGLLKIFAFLLRLKGSRLMRRHTILLHLRGSSLLLIPPLLSCSSDLLDAIFLIPKGARCHGHSPTTSRPAHSTVGRCR